jgi:hypothetical protein
MYDSRSTGVKYTPVSRNKGTLQELSGYVGLSYQAGKNNKCSLSVL